MFLSQKIKEKIQKIIKKQQNKERKKRHWITSANKQKLKQTFISVFSFALIISILMRDAKTLKDFSKKEVTSHRWNKKQYFECERRLELLFSVSKKASEGIQKQHLMCILRNVQKFEKHFERTTSYPCLWSRESEYISYSTSY